MSKLLIQVASNGKYHKIVVIPSELARETLRIVLTE